MITEYKFGPWLPEVTDYKNPGLEDAKNMVPSPSGYQPVYSLVATAATVSGTILGAKSFERTDGTVVVCVATTSDLYVIVGASASASSLALTLSATDRVVFEQYDAQVFATTKGGDVWQLDDIDTDTSFAVTGGTFPKANAMGRVGDFLVIGDVSDGTDYPYRVQWAPFNNPTGIWGSDIATQADYQPLDAQQGPVTAISGGSFGMVFQKNGISRMSYVGGKAVFEFDLYEKNRGAVAPQSVARVGDRAYFLSYDGFFRTDGASTESISQGRIWAWFIANTDQAYLEEVTSVIDWEKRCVVWYCVATGTGALTYNLQLYFNWETGNWSYARQTCEFGVLASRTSGTTLEGLAVTYPDLDAMTLSLDSEVFRASGRTMAAFVSGTLSTFTGTSLQPTFQTGSFQPVTGKRSFISGVTPLIANEAENTTVSIGTRDAMTKSFVTSSASTVGTLGYAPVNVDGRYFRVNVQVPAGQEWSDAYGFQVEYEAAGR